jgi:hypothetical protein
MVDAIKKDLGNDFDPDEPTVYMGKGEGRAPGVVRDPGSDPMLMAMYERVATILS